MLHLKTNGGAIQILQLKTDGDGKGTSTIMPSFQLMKRRQMERAHCPGGENQSRPSLNRPKPISAHLLSNAPMSQPQKFLFPPEGGNKKQKKKPLAIFHLPARSTSKRHAPIDPRSRSSANQSKATRI
jgi:hypothetical protein